MKLWYGSIVAAFVSSLFLLTPTASAITVCSIGNGCTGTSTAPAYGRLLIGGLNGEYEYIATSTLLSQSGVASFNGRTGAVTPQSGDYTTSQVSEGTNLYWTQTRFDNALSATTSLPKITTLAGLSLPYSQLTGTPDLSGYFTLAGWYATTSAPQLTTLSHLSLPYSQVTGTPDLTQYFKLSDWYATTTDQLREGSTNLYFTNARADARVVAGLAATTSVKSITTLPNLSLPYGQVTGAPDLTAYLTLSAWYGTTTDQLREGSTNLYFSNARVASYIDSSSTVPHVGGSAFGNLLYWNGSGWATTATSSLSLTTSAFKSANVSQWTNDAGYLTSLSGAASSTLLTDNNTFSGNDKFTNSSSDFGGTWQTFAPSHFQTAGTYVTALGNYATTTGTALSLSTSTAAFNGLTFGQTIGVSANSLLFTPTITGTLSNAGLANSTISGVALGSNLNNLTINNSGSGAASGATYNGSAGVTISYNTVGAQVAGTYLKTIGNYATTTGTDISFSTSTLAFNGLTLGNTFAVSSNGLLITPTVSGTLNSAGLTNTAVAAGSYTNTNLTVNAQGQITAASNGSAGGSGNVATSSAETAGQLAVFGSTNGTPAKIYSQATSTLTPSSPLTGSFVQIGSAGSLGIQAASASQAGSMAAADWSLLHTATSTFSAPLVYTASTNAVTCTNASNGVTGCMSAADWGLLHTATTTFSGPLSYSASTNAVTCPTCLTANQTITLSGDESGSGTTAITTAFNLANTHWWTARQNFTNASTSEFTATSSVWFTGITNGLVSADANGLLSASTSVGANFITGTLGTVNTSAPLGGGGALTRGGTLTLTCATCFTGTVSGANGMMAAFNGASSIIATSTILGGNFLATSTTATSTFLGAVHISNSLTSTPFFVGTSTTGCPIYGCVTGDTVDGEYDSNGIAGFNVANANSGTCAGSGFFGDGNIVALNSDYAFFGFTNAGWTGSGCAVGNGTERPESTIISNPTGDINFELASSSNAVSYKWYTQNTHLAMTLNNAAGLLTLTSASTTNLTANLSQIVGDGSGSSLITPLRSISATYATSTAWTGSTTVLDIGVAPFGMTINTARRHTDAGTLNVQLQYGTGPTKPAMLLASSTIGTQSPSSNNTPAKGNDIGVVFGTPASSPTQVNCTFSGPQTST